MRGIAKFLAFRQTLSQGCAQPAKDQLGKHRQLEQSDVPRVDDLLRQHPEFTTLETRTDEMAENVETRTADRGVRRDPAGQAPVGAFTHDGVPQLDRSPVMANEMHGFAVGAETVKHGDEVVDESRHTVSGATGRDGRVSGAAHVIRHDVECGFEERYYEVPDRLVVGESMDQDDGFALGIAAACRAQMHARRSDVLLTHRVPLVGV